MGARTRLATAAATLVVAAGAWLVWIYAPRLASGPVLGDLAPLLAAVAVLAFLAAADAVVQWMVRRHRSDRS
jgi:O-antigen/teichoic acid export membrane protein